MRRLGGDSLHPKDGDYAKNASTVIGGSIPRLQPFPGAHVRQRILTEVVFHQIANGGYYAMNGEEMPLCNVVFGREIVTACLVSTTLLRQ